MRTLLALTVLAGMAVPAYAQMSDGYGNLGPIGFTDGEIVGYVWSNSNENESQCETLGFGKDTVTVYSNDCGGLQAKQTSASRSYPLSSLKIENGAYILNGKTYGPTPGD